MTNAGAADEWDVVVPDDGEELLAELRRRGVRSGQHLHVRPVGADLAGKEDEVEAAVGKAHPEYVGSFDSGRPDLAERSEEILRAHFPNR